MPRPESTAQTAPRRFGRFVALTRHASQKNSKIDFLGGGNLNKLSAYALNALRVGVTLPAKWRQCDDHHDRAVD